MRSSSRRLELRITFRFHRVALRLLWLLGRARRRSRARNGGDEMKRAVILVLISGGLVLSSSSHPAFGGGPVADGATTEIAIPCPPADDGSAVAVGRGCCQQRGGMCRCRGGRVTCCDGSIGNCHCRGDSPVVEPLASEMLS